MKYCRSCGAPMNDGDRYCSRCGAESIDYVSPTAPTSTPATTSRPDMDQPPIGGFVCSLVGICLSAVSFVAFGLVSIAGFILGISGAVYCSKYIKKSGYNIAGFILGLFAIVASVTAFILWVTLSRNPIVTYK